LELKDKNIEYKRYVPCDECREQESKKNKKCFISKPLENGLELEDFYHNKIQVKDQEGLYELYLLFTKQQIERYRKMLGIKGNVKRDHYLDWLIKIGICPYGMITANTNYWYELIAICDGEMGLTMPYSNITEIPDIFFQALGIVRSERGKIRQEEEERGNKKSGNSNNH
jgi:hypothetical protein